MRLKAVIFAAMAIGALYAPLQALSEEAVPTPTPTETAAPAATPATPAPALAQKFWLEVDANDLAAISQALNELPKRVADPLVLKLNAQLAAQAQTAIADGKDKAEKAKKGRK